MAEFLNTNLYTTRPDYFYKVTEFVTTFEKDEGKNKPFTHEEIFKDDNLLKCKAEAEKYYWERLKGLEEGKYFLPFASPKDLVFGKHAAFSITLSLIEYCSEDDQIEHPLRGGDEEDMLESMEIETAVLKRRGFIE